MPGVETEDEGSPSSPRGRLADSSGLRVPGLLLVVAAALAVRAWPLARFPVWGSDTGEYRFLITRLVETGSITFAYDGWGLAYPYFPGLYAAAGSLHAVAGVPLEAAVRWTGPLLGALACGAVALLADHVVEDGRAGLVAGLVAATAMPFAFVTSHTMPGTYGHLLAAAVLLLAYVAATDLLGVPGAGEALEAPGRLVSWGVLVLPLVLLLPVTHHLSLYVAVGALVGGGLVREWSRDRTHRTRAVWEAGLVAALVLLATAWWLGVAEPFRTQIVADVLPGPAGLTVALAYAGLLLPVAAVALTRRRRRGGAGRGGSTRVGAALDRLAAVRARARLPAGVGAIGLAAGAFLGLAAAGAVVLATGIPGTRIQVTPRGLVQVLPLFAFVGLAAPGVVAAAHLRGGEGVQGWLLALLASLAAAVVAGSHVLLPYRHADYLVVVLAVLAGAGLLALRSLPRRVRRLGPPALAVLVVLNGAAAYPPPAVMGGFQEGITHEEMRAVRWAGDNLPPDALVAADHRLSSVLFGYAGVDATWDTSGPVLHAPTASAALENLTLPTPSGVRTVTHVAVSPVMREHGVALYQWENARPLSGDALAKFEDPAFEPVYDRDGVRLYEVNATASS